MSVSHISVSKRDAHQEHVCIYRSLDVLIISRFAFSVLISLPIPQEGYTTLILDIWILKYLGIGLPKPKRSFSNNIVLINKIGYFCLPILLRANLLFQRNLLATLYVIVRPCGIQTSKALIMPDESLIVTVRVNQISKLFGSFTREFTLP